MRILFFDDDKQRHRLFQRSFFSSGCEIVKAYNVKEALEALNTYSPFDIVCLDHDMD